MIDPRDIVYGVVLENGKRWGEAAAPFQRRDLDAFYDPDGPRLHFWTRSRGSSKTEDVGAMACASLVTEASAASSAAVVAVNADQAALLIDSIAGLVRRTEALRDVLEVTSFRVVNRATGAAIEVLSAADGSALYGRRDWLTVCDEFCNWPVQRKFHQQYVALRSGVQKLRGRLVLISTAGEPSHPSRRVRDEALRSPDWDVHEVLGPPPWIDPADLRSLRAELRSDEFARLIENQWTDSPDVLVSAEDLEAACILPGVLEPVPGFRYLVTLDYGPKRDRTVVAVCHAERLSEAPGASRRVVLDRMRVWQGSRFRSVSLTDVEEFVAEVSHRYNRAVVHCDPYQSIGLIQRLNARGVRAVEFPFTSVSVNRVASALMVAFQNGLIVLPDDRELRDELSRVRLKQTGPGSLKLDNPSGTHDDRATVLGMACAMLQGESGAGRAYLQFMRNEIAARAAAAPSVDPRLRSLPRFVAVDDRGTCRCPPGVRRFFTGVCVNCGGVPPRKEAS